MSMRRPKVPRKVVQEHNELDDHLRLFLDETLSTGRSTVTIAMADLFYAVLPTQEEEEGYEPIADAVLRRGIPLWLMGPKKRVEIIQRLTALAEKRNRSVSVDGNLIVVSAAQTASDRSVSAKSGFRLSQRGAVHDVF
jgi:hypothetical protein